MLSLSGIRGIVKSRESRVQVCPNLSLDEMLALQSDDTSAQLRNLCKITGLELLSIVETLKDQKARILVANAELTAEFFLPEICRNLPLGDLITRNKAISGYKKIFSSDEIFPANGIWPDFVSTGSNLGFVFLPLRQYATIVPSFNSGFNQSDRFVLATSSTDEPQAIIQPAFLAAGLILLSFLGKKATLLEKSMRSLSRIVPGLDAVLLADHQGRVDTILVWNLRFDPSAIESSLEPLIAKLISSRSHETQAKLFKQSDKTIRITKIEEKDEEPVYLVTVQSPKNQESSQANDSTLMRFMSSVAHEIKNPLTGIAAGVQYLARKLPSDLADGDTLGFILDEIDRLNRIVEDLYRIARPSELVISQIDLRQVISKSLLSLSELLLRKQIKVIQDFPDQIPQIMADADRLQQILVNIIKNAIEASPERGLLTISVKVCDKRVIISIRDQGSGIPEEISERLFEPFYSTKQGGTGLGLCISKRFIEQHGGRLSYRNSEEGGAEFIIELPTEVLRDGKHLSG